MSSLFTAMSVRQRRVEGGGGRRGRAREMERRGEERMGKEGRRWEEKGEMAH